MGFKHNFITIICARPTGPKEMWSILFRFQPPSKRMIWEREEWELWSNQTPQNKNIKSRFESNRNLAIETKNHTRIGMKIKAASKCINWKAYSFLSNLCGAYVITVSSVFVSVAFFISHLASLLWDARFRLKLDFSFLFFFSLFLS